MTLTPIEYGMLVALAIGAISFARLSTLVILGCVIDPLARILNTLER